MRMNLGTLLIPACRIVNTPNVVGCAEVRCLVRVTTPGVRFDRGVSCRARALQQEERLRQLQRRPANK
jgi:hypothetical protein